MSASFDPNRVAVIGNAGGNVLIRGNEPLLPDGSFAYAAIGEATKIDLTQYRLFDVCLIDNAGERACWSAEWSAYGQSPLTFPASVYPPYAHVPNWSPMIPYGSSVAGHPGSMYWWPIEGLPPGQDPSTLLTTPGYDFSGLVDFVGTQLQTGTGKAIYVHCMLGADRTGAWHVCHLMKILGMSYEEALRIASTATAAGAPAPYYQNLAQAYAKWLRP